MTAGIRAQCRAFRREEVRFSWRSLASFLGPMTPEHWNSGSLVFAMWVNGAALTETDADGNVLSDATWTPVLDTTQDTGSPASSTALPADSAYCVSSRHRSQPRNQR